jgi:hypothetical protein
MRELGHCRANALCRLAEIEDQHHATAWSHASGIGSAFFFERRFICGGTGGPHGVQAMLTF